jgi:hypothetical protein
MCKNNLPPTEQSYVLRVDLYAAADDLDVSSADLSGDTREDLRRLIDKLEDLNDDEAEEETDRVFERHAFELCSSCRDEIHEILKKKRKRA